MSRPQPTQRGLGKTRLPTDIPKHCTKELSAVTRRHMLVDDLIEMKCLYNESGTPADVLTPPIASQVGNKKETNFWLLRARHRVGVLPHALK